MTTHSWVLGRDAPLRGGPMALTATAFGSSSLSAQASHDFAMDQGKGVPHLTNMVHGVPVSGAEFNNEDRSPLGVEVETARRAVKFTGYPEMSTPNVNSLSRSTTQLGARGAIAKFNSVK